MVRLMHAALFMALLLIAMSAPLAAGAVGTGKCFDPTRPGTDQDTVRTACLGIGVSSTAGFGGVELCGDCYACGFADGVCPEEFTNGTMYASCLNCADPDCMVVIQGYVTQQDNPAVGVNGATVTAQLPHLEQLYSSSYTTTTITNPATMRAGYYALSAPRGDYDLLFSADGYDTTLVAFSGLPPRQATYTVNAALHDGSCHADCTNSAGLCRKECAGYNEGTDQCIFATHATYDVASLCDDRAENTTIVLATAGDESTVVRCCEGSVVTERRPKVSIDGAQIKNLVTKTIVAEKEGMLVKVNIIIYDK